MSSHDESSRLLRSTIGQKAVMAVTGLILLGFVFVHMLGNLQVYLGPGHLDEYGASLRRLPVVLWGARLVLLVAVVLHGWAAWATTRVSRAARPVGYRKRKDIGSSYASHTMRWGGVTLALFIVYHLLHFTIGTVHPQFREGAVHHNFVTGFQVWYVSLFYLLAMGALGLHLWHGAWSVMQTLGFNHPRYNGLRRTLASAFTAIVVIGNVSFPLAVLLGFVKE
jgi:succinate dehydrogenase / fumarate reductase, cytochrome b subunit